jgi:hypothetical protein
MLPDMLRRLVNIASIACLVLCVVLMGMWVRSDYWVESLAFNPCRSYSIGATSALGRIAFGGTSAPVVPQGQPFKFRSARAP